MKTETERRQNHEKTVDATLSQPLLSLEVARAIEGIEIAECRDLVITEERKLTE